MQNFLNTTTHNIAWFMKRYQAGELQLKAPFQRNPVWTDKQRAYLIDTIVRGFPVPELYMQEYTDAKGNDQYVVVDGQQRLRACIEFIQGSFALDPTDSPDRADMKFEDLSEADKKQVYNYSFVVRVLPDMPEEDLRAMFRRLNRNVVALNAQELRHATYWGEFISTVEKLADDDRWSMLGIFTPNDVRRMLDIEYISELAVAYLHGPQNKKEKLDEWYQTYEREFPRRDDVVATFNEALSELTASVPALDRTRWRKKSDFYSLFLVLARHKVILPLSREGRSQMRELLVQFGNSVDAYLSDPEAEGLPESAKVYALAVERAASDLANRRSRDAIIEALLWPLLEAEQRAAGDAPQAARP